MCGFGLENEKRRGEIGCHLLSVSHATNRERKKKEYLRALFSFCLPASSLKLSNVQAVLGTSLGTNHLAVGPSESLKSLYCLEITFPRKETTEIYLNCLRWP